MGRKKSAATIYKESLTYDDYIVNGVVPFMTGEMDKMVPIFEKFKETKHIDKAEWEYLKKCADKLADVSKSDGTFMNFFTTDKISDVKYKEKHSSYYEVVNESFAKFFVNKANASKESDDERQNAFFIYAAAKHLFAFVACPEKI